MEVVIFDKIVRNNLTLFRHLIHRQAEKADRHFKVARKAYQAFVNTHTGELRFIELEKNFTPDENWCPIIIQLRPDNEGAFEVLQSEHQESFACFAFQPEAYALLSKTMHLLNQLSYHPKNGKNPFWILRHVAHIDFVLSEEEEGKRNLIHNAWHQCNRTEAEKLLKHAPAGTYLFRKGRFAEMLEDSINESRESPVTCITLTYQDGQKKICEKALVYGDGQWVIFDDDLYLRGPHYTSVKDLIEAMGETLTYPLREA